MLVHAQFTEVRVQRRVRGKTATAKLYAYDQNWRLINVKIDK